MDNLNNAQNVDLNSRIEELQKEKRQLEERIEADRNAIMQIQFEANQHKQEELDLHETYVWRTGLKIEKILQKTGISFIRSLLVLSDYKRMGLMVTLRKGITEALLRENVSHNKRRKLQLCKAKFNRYKNERNKMAENLSTRIEVPCKKGLVSVVLPVYNGANIIEKSIASVLNQSYKNIELLCSRTETNIL